MSRTDWRKLLREERTLGFFSGAGSAVGEVAGSSSLDVDGATVTSIVAVLSTLCFSEKITNQFVYLHT